MTRTLFTWMAAALLMAACAAGPAVIEKREVAAPAEKTAAEALPERAPRPSEGGELLLEGVELLNLPEPARARPVFVSLVRLYPQGRWRPAAEAFIRLIDEREASREASRLDRLTSEEVEAERGRALQENEALKKTVRELKERMERFQAEAVALAKDNEQLRQDIQRLKSLEIELEKRGRTLR